MCKIPVYIHACIYIPVRVHVWRCTHVVVCGVEGLSSFHSRVLWAGTTSLTWPSTGLRPMLQRASEESTVSRKTAKTR